MNPIIKKLEELYPESMKELRERGHSDANIICIFLQSVPVKKKNHE
ncbi:MAG: hypothetical protein ACXADY_15365 [Candidatus Hodarchaeales archaeon]|jgi:hypothetical protein